MVLADSKDDLGQALKMLVGAERRADDDTPPQDRLAALALLAELQVRVGAPDDARATLARLDALPVEDGPEVAAVRAQARELARDLSCRQPLQQQRLGEHDLLQLPQVHRLVRRRARGRRGPPRR